MTATQAPTPGPLDSESVKLLVKGDLCLTPDGAKVFDHSTHWDNIFVLWFADHEPFEPDTCTFIGRPDADGWMPWSGGENPVPGQGVECKTHNGRTWGQSSSESLRWSHLKPPSGSDIIAFRLAPTAPVEASGSEREHGPKCWGKTSISDEMMYCYCGSTDSPPGETREYPWSFYDALKVAGIEHASFCVNGVTVFGDRSAAKEAERWHHESVSVETYWRPEVIRQRDLLSALALGGQKGDSETLRVLLGNLVIAQTLSKDIRQKATDEARSYLYDLRHTPQPSGETREAVARVIDPWPFGVVANIQHTERAATDRDKALAKADAILALLSASPLALGGQQGEFLGHLVAPKSGVGTVFVPKGEPVPLVAGRGSVTPVYSGPQNVTTPARAEAQDEVAAGEWDRIEHEMWIANASEFVERSTSPKDACEIIDRLLAVIDALSPSPTPAADADRVRIAVEALEKADAAARSGAAMSAADYSISAERLGEEIYKITTPALAALKSTAAKEGGE